MERKLMETLVLVLGIIRHSGKVWDGASSAPQKPDKGFHGCTDRLSQKPHLPLIPAHKLQSCCRLCWRHSHGTKQLQGASRKVTMARKAENSCNCQEMIKHQHQGASQCRSHLLNYFFGVCSEWLRSWRGAVPGRGCQQLSEHQAAQRGHGGTAALAALGAVLGWDTLGLWVGSWGLGAGQVPHL